MSQTANVVNSEDQPFGYQLVLDLYDCREGACDDLSLCYQFLDEIVTDLGMEKQSPPSIFRSDATKFPDKAGLSGWVPLIESSVVIHTLTVKNFISIDVYCCRWFDVEFAKAICNRFFGPGRVEEQYFVRGKNYYKIDTSYHSVTVDKADAAQPKINIEKKVAALQ